MVFWSGDRQDPSDKYSIKGVRRRNLLALLGLLAVLMLLASRVDLDERSSVTTKARQVELAADEYPVGYVRKPSFADGDKTGDDGKLHVIFSSGCNYFQHWQSELLLASALLAGQRGRITRIVSGCHDKSAETVKHRHQNYPAGTNDLLVPLEKLNRSVNENFGLYITPSFRGARDFPWINKPNSINYFMEHAREELDAYGETVIAILDPDFLFLRPLSQVGTDPDDIIATRHQDEAPNADNHVDWVRRGRPVAQRYGLEGAWTTRFSVEEITNDPNSPALKWNDSYARWYTSVGPPLMLHVDDITDLSKLWVPYMTRVLKRDKDILADMWAYSIAAAHLDLKHTTLDHYMISAYGRSGQAYPWIDAWKSMSCLNPKVPNDPGAKLPIFIHMASNFKAPDSALGPWMFHKGHVPGNFFECDSPLIIEPPDNLWEVTSDWKAKQNAWILCHIIPLLNRVSMLYKKKFCIDGYERRKLIRLIQHKSKDRKCHPYKDKWCYPLAQIEGLGENWRPSYSTNNFN
mmetsp:Transcript_12729/g.20582  ORF Transcript_12729/g.20582 Transcript_12729/m.20582 type:complete len:520 (+) Transcript_12729:23-1582(+)